MSELLVLELGFLWETEACKNILQGTFEILYNIDQFSIEYIKALAKPIMIRNLSKAIFITEGFRVG